MSREILRPGIILLAAAAAIGGALLLGGSASEPQATQGSPALQESAPAPIEARGARDGAVRPEPFPALVETEVRASSQKPSSGPTSLSSESSLPRELVSTVAASLPPISQERSSDGLPVSALRCTFMGGEMHCGGCRTDSDCPSGHGCVANRQTRRFECLASECEEDVHCFPGELCRAVTTGATGQAPIRRCSPEGLRREGESCDSLPVSPAGSCREGLRCVQGVWGVACRMEEPASCPVGYACEESPDGPACVPDCRQRGCAEGQRCKRIDDSRYRCLEQVRGDCPEVPCAKGERCNGRLRRGRGVFWCARVCNPLLPESCPGGEVCGMGSSTISTCYRPCDPQEPDSCGAGWWCTTLSEDMTLWGCSPWLD